MPIPSIFVANVPIDTCAVYTRRRKIFWGKAQIKLMKTPAHNAVRPVEPQNG